MVAVSAMLLKRKIHWPEPTSVLLIGGDTAAIWVFKGTLLILVHFLFPVLQVRMSEESRLLIFWAHWHSRDRRVRSQDCVLLSESQGSSVRCLQKVLFSEWSCCSCLSTSRTKSLPISQAAIFGQLQELEKLFGEISQTVSLYSCFTEGPGKASRADPHCTGLFYAYKDSVHLFPS